MEVANCFGFSGAVAKTFFIPSRHSQHLTLNEGENVPGRVLDIEEEEWTKPLSWHTLFSSVPSFSDDRNVGQR
jgi:hypothetical protein